MSLPDCHSRRELEAERERFYCLHPRVHAPGGIVLAGVCRLCTYWREAPPADPRPFPPPEDRDNAGRCIHLGDQTGWRECLACQGRVRVKVFACAHPHHCQTTLEECRRCTDHSSPAGEVS